jgi:hypothetical protein
MINHPNRSRRRTATAAAATATPTTPIHNHDADYESLLTAVRSTFARSAEQPLFATSATGLYETYLDNLTGERLIHTCHACRRFIGTFGALVTIGEDGHTTSAIWDPETVPAFYRSAVQKMASLVEHARVTGVFLSSDRTWGTPVTGTWTHFSVVPSSVYSRATLAAGQAMAAKREDHATVARALADFTPATITEAVRLLEAGHLHRSERFIAPLHWLADLHAKRNIAKGNARDNLLWRAVATAPDGYCHPRTSMTGSLLEDIAAGLSFADVKAKFDAKMHPLQYQRPQAAPAAGNIAAGEKIVEQMGIRRSLERRFARLDEIETAWTPFTAKAAPTVAGGVFSHLSTKGTPGPVRVSDAPPATMTWEKFARTVLPGAEAIEVHIGVGSMNFIALTTAAHEDAPPILRWDRADRRNPIAWYVYHGGSPPSQWGLAPGWTRVTAIAALPTMWGDKPSPHLTEGFVLVLNGCADTQTGQGNALFPECLIDDLRPVRATIEAYSRGEQIAGREEASACGLDVRKGSTNLNYLLRVTTAGLKTDYRIDRWD